jgi:uncharacterized damage-inducible protein DinB
MRSSLPKAGGADNAPVLASPPVGTLEAPTDERAILTFFLDWDRAVVENKVAGLDRARATAVATPSGVTLLGIVAHLTVVEARWFRLHMLGDEDVPPAEDSFAVDPAHTVEDVVAAYRAECERSRAIAGELDLDTISVVPQKVIGQVNLRYLLSHMIDETSRHLGHMDVLRELTDGRTGDG